MKKRREEMACWGWNLTLFVCASKDPCALFFRGYHPVLYLIISPLCLEHDINAPFLSDYYFMPPYLYIMILLDDVFIFRFTTERDGTF